MIDEKIQHYAEQHTSAQSDLLTELLQKTYATRIDKSMLSGFYQGRLLAMFSKMIAPRRILEIGTYMGYSALCLAEGLKENGKLITIDINEELENFVRGFFKESPLNDKIDFRIGNAIEMIPTLTQTFDLVFIDADKLNYTNYYDLVFEKVRQGGYIISDNVLWSGKVVDKTKNDKDTLAIRAFNQKLHNDIRVENILLPIRDGLMIVRKV